MRNKNLISAKKAKNDEFYTQLADIERECFNYKDLFRDKVIYCNCDDARESNFFRYFSMNFEFFGLKRLITTGYKADGHGVAFIYEGDKNGNRVVDDEEVRVVELEGDGDFRSPECIELLKQADIIVTNPPFSCYSSDTEVLTNNGWKYIKDVNIETDLIYSLNPDTNEIEIVKAVDFISSPVNGKLYHYSSHNMDFAVTGNHKMFTYYKNCKGDIVYKGLVDASDIKKSDLLKLTGFEWEGKDIPKFILPETTQKEQYSRKEIVVPSKEIDMKSWLEFFGFYLADGCIRLGNNVQGNPRYVISIKQNVANESYVIKLCKNIGFDCHISRRKDGNNNYIIYSKQLWEYLSKFGKSENKYIPREFLELNKEYLDCLFRGYINGDSHNGNGDIILSSKSKMLMDNMQEIILKLFGQICKVRTVDGKYKGESYIYYMISLQRNIKHRNFAKYGVPKMIDYNDNVYCLTLEKNHIMLIRHNNTIGWCGNCFREYVGQLMDYNKKFLIIGNYNAVTYKEIFPLIKDNKMWLGTQVVKEFITPLTTITENTQYYNDQGQIIQKFGNICWFTNLPNKKRTEPLDLYKKYNPKEYPQYDNYNAINVNKVADIPMDYEVERIVTDEELNKLKEQGFVIEIIEEYDLTYKVKIKNPVMGVPITFLDNYNPDQFEIVSFRKGEDGKDLIFTREREREFNLTFVSLYDFDCGVDKKCGRKNQWETHLCENNHKTEEEPIDYFFPLSTNLKNGMINDWTINGKKGYCRILIRRK